MFVLDGIIICGGSCSAEGYKFRVLPLIQKVGLNQKGSIELSYHFSRTFPHFGFFWRTKKVCFSLGLFVFLNCITILIWECCCCFCKGNFECNWWTHRHRVLTIFLSIAVPFCFKVFLDRKPFSKLQIKGRENYWQNFEGIFVLVFFTLLNFRWLCEVVILHWL